MTVEHLLLALLSNTSAREALEACKVDLVILRQELEHFISQTTPLLPEDDSRDTQPTLSFQRVLQRAVFHVQSSGRNEVTGANVLVAIFSEQESQAAYLLRKHDVSRLDVVNFISHGMVKVVGQTIASQIPLMPLIRMKRQLALKNGWIALPPTLINYQKPVKLIL